LVEDGWLFWPADPNHHYRLWFLRPNPAQRTHHLQMIQHDHPDIQALIAFRDALRRDPKAREAYSLLKEVLAKEYKTDRNAYSNAKTEFVQSILKASGSDPSSRKPVEASQPVYDSKWEALITDDASPRSPVGGFRPFRSDEPTAG
jgi:hypothetical protein